MDEIEKTWCVDLWSANPSDEDFEADDEHLVAWMKFETKEKAIEAFNNPDNYFRWQDMKNATHIAYDWDEKAASRRIR